jgi:plastocyanin
MPTLTRRRFAALVLSLSSPPLRAGAADAATVTIDNFTFTPPEITVAPGTTVTWKNHDDIPHSVVANDRSFRSKALDTGDAYAFTFASAGRFEYFCGLHPHMVGTIVVAA